MTRPSFLRQTLALAAKDWKLFWADRRAAALCFVVPIVLASTFGMIFAKPTDPAGDVRLPLLVAAEADDPFSRRVVADLLASPRLEAVEVPANDVAARVAGRRPAVAVVLPRDFAALATWTPGRGGERPLVGVVYHPAATAERQWAEGAVTEAVMRRLAKERLGGLLSDAASELPFRVAATAAATPGASFNAYTHSFCGMTLQYLLFWGMESGLMLLRERQRGLWRRVRAAPVPLSAVLVGKALATAAVALLQVLATFAFGYAAFGVTVGGSAVGFVLLAVAASGLAAATGLLVAAVGGTEPRARGVSILVILGVSMVGGLWLPAFLLPAWMRDAALSLPTTWAMRGLDAVTWQGQGLAAALPSVAAVAAFTVLFLAVAVARLAADESRRRRGIA